MSFKNAVHKVVDFIHRGEQKVSQIFVDLFGEQKAAQFGHAVKDVLQTEVGKIVTAAVGAVENASPAMDGATKFAQAYSSVEAELKSAGKDVPDHLLRMLIELAVSAAKDHFPSA